MIEATGVLRGRRRRAVDSTVLDDAVATQDTVTQLIGAIRRVARQVPGAAEVIAAECRGHDYTQPGKPRIDWTDPQAKQELVSALVTDANAVVAALTGRRSDQVELDETARRRWRCWRWWPGRTWNRPRAPTGGTGGGGSRGGWPRTG